MVSHATMSTYTNKIANGNYTSQIAKLQALQRILTEDYKWSHREMKQMLLDIIAAFASIDGSDAASSAGIDINNPDSWDDNNDSGSGNDGTGNNGGSSGGDNNSLTEEELLKLLEKYVGDYVNIDISKIVAEIQQELYDSQLFKDLVSQLLDEGTQALIAEAMADEEQKRVEADAAVLRSTAEKLTKEAKDRADAIANEAAVRAQQFADEATERNQQILAESQARIAADEAEIRARKDAIDKETEARTAAVKKESDDRVEAIRTAAETAQSNLIAESTKLGTKITNLESVTATQAQQISTISASNRQEIAAAVQEEKTARIAADEAEARERQTLATQLQDDIAAGIQEEKTARATDKDAQAIINTNLSAKLRDAESAITSEQSARVTADEAQTNLINGATSRIGAVESNITNIERTVADNEQALSTKIEGLQSKFGNIDVGGRNLLIGTKNKIIESSGNSNTEIINYQFSPNVDVETIKDFTVSCEIDLKNAKFQSGTTNGSVGVEVQLTYTDNSVEYKNVWFTDLATPKTVKQKLKLTSSINENKTIRKINGVIQVRNVSSTSVKVYNAKLEKGNIATDWTEAPEDIGVEINEVSAKVDSAKETLANDDKALAQRIDTLNSTFNTNKADIDTKYQTLAEKDTALTSQLETLKTTVNNNTAAISAETIARTNDDNSFTLQITDLTTKFNQSSARITSESTARSDADAALTLKLDQLTARTGKAESDITVEQTARTTLDKALTARINTLNAAHENTKASVSTLANTVATNEESAATELRKVDTKVEDAKTVISAETTARTHADEALGTRIDTVQTNLNKANAAITEEAQTRATNDTANAGAIRVVQSNLDTTNANLVQEQQTRATKDEALTSSLNALTTRMGSAESRIITEERTRATADEALTQKVTQLTSNFNQANSAITSLQTTVANQDEARSQEISTLSAKIGDMRIGGRNYFRETGNLLDTSMWIFGKSGTQTQDEVARQRDVLTLTAATASWCYYHQSGTYNPLLNFEADEVLTVSFEANASVTSRDFIKFVFRQHFTGSYSNTEKNFTPTEANKWFKYSFTFVVPQKHTNFTQFSTIFEIRQIGTLQIRKMKLERGNVATDWTEAPEDMTRLNESTAAELTVYKSSQSIKDQSQTDLINSALSRMGTAESAITNLETTRANKTEVAALARTTLKAEWDKAAGDAAHSAIDAFKVTYATDKSATATSVDSVRSDLSTKIDNMSVGTNLIPNSDFAAGYDGWSMFNWSNTAGLATGFNLEAGSVNKYNLKDERVFYVRDERTAAAGATYLQALAQNNRARFAVTPGETLQGSVLAAGIAMVSGIEAIHVYLDFYDNNAWLGRVDRNIANAKTPTTGHLNGMRNDGAYTSLDRFHTLWINEVVPAGAVWGQLSVRFWFDPSVTQRYGFFVRPQVCVVPSLSQGYVPYQVGTQGLSAQIVETKTTAANIDGKVNSLYTLKVESAANGRKVVSGLMMGANENESQFGIVADKFFIGNTQNGSIVAPFIVSTVGSTAKVVLKGDLIADGMILGKHIAASQTLSSPIIIGGSLNIANRFKVMSNGDVLIQAASGNTGMKITSERIDVYDTSGKLRVRMGKLT